MIKRRLVKILVPLGVVFLIALAWPVQFGGLTGYTVVSGTSMNPTYHTGDFLITFKSFNWKRGDVIVYAVPRGELGAGYLVVHRLVGGSSVTGWQAQGDNNPALDIWKPQDKDIRGEVVLMIPKAGLLLGVLHNTFVFGVLCAFIMAYLLWPREVKDRMDELPKTGYLVN